jgi:hypothetical protein
MSEKELYEKQIGILRFENKKLHKSLKIMYILLLIVSMFTAVGIVLTALGFK